MNLPNIGAPWRKGDSLSCTVFDSEGGVVATIYGRTTEQQLKRLQVVKVSPQMLHTLKALLPHLESQHDGDGGPYWPAELVRNVIAEAEPV